MRSNIHSTLDAPTDKIDPVTSRQAEGVLPQYLTDRYLIFGVVVRSSALLSGAMHGVFAPAFVVFDGVEFHDRDALAVIGDEALEIHETRHLSGSALHLVGEFEVAAFDGFGVKPGPKYGENHVRRARRPRADP